MRFLQTTAMILVVLIFIACLYIVQNFEQVSNETLKNPYYPFTVETQVKDI